MLTRSGRDAQDSAGHMAQSQMSVANPTIPRGFTSEDLLSTKEVSSLNLTIKNYQLEHGLSTRFFRMDKTARDNYQITGPLGKGLGLTPKSKGAHIAFAAGTGVLAFVDMLAKLSLQTLGSLPENDERLDDAFKLVFFASF